jgi:small subunit ribosomal protein S1
MAKMLNNNKNTIPDFSSNEDFEKLFEDFSKEHEKKEGTITTGTITEISKDEIRVDIGIKDEGIISVKEFVQNGKLPTLSIGDKIDVYIQSYENRSGQVVLSREKAVREKLWKELEQAMKNKTQVPGVIFGRIKGGLMVDLSGVVAFLPGSQIDIKPVKDINHLLGVEQPFIVLKMDQEQGNVVVSRRAIIEESREEAKSEMLSQIKVGQVLEGVVKNITDYGAFVDLGRIDGLLHITDISWSKINHPSEMLSIGQHIQVQIIKYDEDNRRVSLGMKQLTPNPWQGIDKKYPVNTKMKGQVTNITDYGIFIELEPGIEGLVHVSELNWISPNTHPKNIVKEGEELEFIVLEVDVEKHRISLGMKNAGESIWKTLEEKYPIGSTIEGKVKKILNFGLLIDFNEKINGLVHINDLSWSKDPQEAIKDYKEGDSVKVAILSLDASQERLSMGIKHLTDDPFENAMKDIKKGITVTCVVTEITADGIEVSLENNFKVFIRRSELSSEKSEQRPERFAVGDKVDAKIVKLDKTTRVISLSIKALELDEQKQKIAEYGSASSGASLGDILGNAIEEQKKKQKNSK